jgi:DNA-binding SARP family transcriptional activator
MTRSGHCLGRVDPPTQGCRRRSLPGTMSVGERDRHVIDVKVFGPTVISGAGVRLVASDLGGNKPRQLLEMLALDLGTPIAKDLLAERLWDGRPPASYIANVESYVGSLRRRLGLVGGRRGPLATTHHGYLLDPEHVRVDVASVRTLLGGDLADVTLGLDLMSGKLLADEPYAAWASAARDSFDELLSVACTRAAQAANERNDSALAVRLATEATRRSYCAEPPVRELMIGLNANGERPQALQAYQTLRAAMLDELGLEPGSDTQELYLSILRGNPAEQARPTDRDEVRTLLELLSRALEDDSAMFSGMPAMAEVGQLLLARAG